MRAEVAGRRVRHLVRNRQREYTSRRRRNEARVETRCGLHVEDTAPPQGQRPCRSCYR